MSSFTVKTYRVVLTNCAAPYAYIMMPSDTSSTRARLNFYPMPSANSYSLTQNGDFVDAKLPYSAFASFVDVLRNEKPVTFNWSTTTGVCTLSTGNEPVGEEETSTLSVIGPFPVHAGPLPIP